MEGFWVKLLYPFQQTSREITQALTFLRDTLPKIENSVISVFFFFFFCLSNKVKGVSMLFLFFQMRDDAIIVIFGSSIPLKNLKV